MSSFFSFGKPGSSAIKSAAPAIRKEIRHVSKPTPAAPLPRQTSSGDRPTPQISRASSSSQPPNRASKRGAETSRLTAVRAGTKRKSSSPSVQLFDSSSSGESDSGAEEARDSARKRARLAAEVKPTFTRSIRDVKNWDKPTAGPLEFVHGADLTSGVHAERFRPAFGEGQGVVEVELQYPCPGITERFQLVSPIESDGYKPLDDIHQTIIHILTYYLPDTISAPLLSPSTGIPFILSRAFNHQDLPSFLAALTTFNTTILTSLPAIVTHLSTHPCPPLPLTSHILSQIYTRTVSPNVDLLRRYTAGSSNVYGELLPPFVSQIFADTALRPHHTFLDLGSGVGNVALQAALQIGCAAHGVEVMANPASLAALQSAEFPARARAWGLAVGRCELWQGDFRLDERAVGLLRTADVVLVNNQAFTPDLNNTLSELFLELKEGARVVSLKSFVPAGWRLSVRTSGSVIACLDVERREFWRDCVSWMGEGGEYFVAVKDSGRVARFLKARGAGR